MNHLNRTALVTGAAQGIGRRTAELLGEYGHAVALADLRPTNDVGDVLRKRSATVLEFRGDISDENTVVELAARVEREWGHIDLLVNNAGISSICRAEDSSVQEFRRVLEINLVAPFMLAKTFERRC